MWTSFNIILYLFESLFMSMDTANVSRARENQILIQISSFSRKQPQEKGCRQLLTLTKETDLSYLPLLISTANKYFAPVFYMWQKYERSLGPSINNFMNTIHSKITHSKIAPLRVQFQHLKNKYQRASRKRVTLLKEAEITLEETDNKLKSFVTECKKIRNESTRQKRSLLVQHEDTEKTAPSLATIDEDLGKNYQQTRITVLRELYVKIKLSYEKAQARKVQCKLVHRLEERPAVSRDCLNCLSFVYENEDLNFPSSRQPVSYFGRILSLSTIQREILQQIISYLNGKGGVLLIGTQRMNNRILPIVEEIAEFHKEQQENRLQAALGFIVPAVSLNKQIEHAFLPIAENSRKDPENTHPVWKGNGACILRITVIPTEPHKTYHYSIPSNQAQADPSVPNIPPPTAAAAFNFFRHTQLGVRELKDEDIYEFMKTRYRQYDPSNRPQDFVLRDRGNYHPCLIQHIDRCRPAEKGAPFYGDNSYYEDAQKKRENALKSINPLLTPGVQSFKSITLLVVVSSLLDRISTILTSEQKLQSKITPAFKDENFKLSNNTFLIFHNCKFQKLKNGINKQKVQLKAQNDKKDVILISTLGVLSLKEEDMTRPVQKQLEDRIIQLTKEKLEFKFIEGVCYIKCLSVITAVYVYFYLQHHHNIRGKFEKIPQGSNARSKQHRGGNLKRGKAGMNFDRPFNDRTGGAREQEGGHYEKNYRRKEYSQDYYPSDEEQYENYQEQHETTPTKRQNYSKREDPPQSEGNHSYANEYTPSYSSNHSSITTATGESLNSYQETYSSAPVQERVPLLLYSQCDYANGLRYDYYDNSVVYIFVLSTGQYYNCQYYQMQQPIR